MCTRVKSRGESLRVGDKATLLYAPLPSYQWGLRPDWNTSAILPNARVEKVREGCWKSYGKALLPIDSFFERSWEILPAYDDSFLVLCVYHENTFAIVTRESYGEASRLHHRMPQFIRVDKTNGLWYPDRPELMIRREINYLSLPNTPC